MGAEFDPREPISYEIEVPILSGSKTIKGNAKITFTKVDYENYFCVFKQEARLDPEETKQAVNLFFESTKQDDLVIENHVLEVNEDNTFEFYYNPGVPHKIELNREIIIDTYKRIEKTIIELVYNE